MAVSNSEGAGSRAKVHLATDGGSQRVIGGAVGHIASKIQRPCAGGDIVHAGGGRTRAAQGQTAEGGVEIVQIQVCCTTQLIVHNDRIATVDRIGDAKFQFATGHRGLASVSAGSIEGQDTCSSLGEAARGCSCHCRGKGDCIVVGINDCGLT